MKQFDFGQNWADFSSKGVTEASFNQARAHFAELLYGIELADRSFLDIGFGLGFSLLSAQALGARVVGCDINPKCHEVIERIRQRFPARGAGPITLVIGSILNDVTLMALRACP